MNLVALPEETGLETAGAISYWTLSGEIDLATIRDALLIEGLEERLLPGPVTPAEALARGAKAACADAHQLIRPMKRGEWAFIQETLVPATTDREPQLEHQHLLSGRVIEDSTPNPDGSRKAPVFDVRPTPGVERTEAIDQLIDQILGEAARQRGILSANDVSWWLVYVAKQLHAVSLRERGGVYFVPRDVLPTWRLIARVLGEETGHQVFEIPAVKSEQAVEAILVAVRAHVRAAFDEAREYLGGTHSTRGLNALERQLAQTKDYVDHYVRLLDVALPDLTEQLEGITGALVAARLAHDNAGA